MQHSQAYPAPVPRLGDFDVTLALGVGLVAILVDLIAVSLRRAPLVGLVFLAIYMAPVSLLSGHVSMWAFIPGALGYVFLLAATEREKVLGWGRGLDQTGAAPDSLDRGGGLEGMGRRAGLGAVACAVVIPLFVPTMPTQLFGDGGTDGEGGSGGSGPVSVRNPILDMRRNLTSQSREPLISVTTPDGEPSYLRLTSLPELTAAGWAPASAVTTASPWTTSCLGRRVCPRRSPASRRRCRSTCSPPFPPSGCLRCTRRRRSGRPVRGRSTRKISTSSTPPVSSRVPTRTR
ncbi:MAG: DUF3488 domain-containing protein [Nocardioidaceae bacterium]